MQNNVQIFVVRLFLKQTNIQILVTIMPRKMNR